MLDLIAQALWLIIPAYAANAFPPVVHGTHPLDFGKNLNRHRILGDGKTIEGTVAGISFGTFIGIIQIFMWQYLPQEIGLMKTNIALVVLLSIGAILGDIVGAFFKRRLSIERGKPAPVLDQLDFLVGALIFGSLVYTPPSLIILILIVITPILHLLTNRIGYILGIKKTPW